MSQSYELGIRITADGRILTAEIKRGEESLKALGATAQQAGAQTAAALGSIDKPAEALNATLKRTGMSAAQTAAALRGVPAQFTDIVTSLASGQAPLTVLLQQGGQLKDMFGGVGPAARALGGYVAGLVTPLTVSAAAAAALGYAFYSAQSEADEFKKNLILTGNVSGLTVNRFQEMAAALGDMSGITRGAAAEALTTMAASGNISAASIQNLTQAALQMERAGGPAVADTVKQFEDLGKKPVEASLALNAQTHYLTLAVYEQIKSLQDQGKTSEAAAVAQKAWADAIEQRVPKMVENLGYLETAWDNLKRSAAGAWDFMKDIGRNATAAERVAELRQKIAEADRSIAAGSINSNRLLQQRVQWQQELNEKLATTAANEKAASEEAARQEKNDRSVEVNAHWDKVISAQRSNRQKYADELKKLDADRAADLVSEEKYLTTKASLAKQYEDKGGKKDADKAAREAAIEQRKLDDLLALGAGEARAYAENMALLQKYALSHTKTLQEGTPELERYRAAVIKQIAANTAAGKAWHESSEAAKEANHSLVEWQAAHKNQVDRIADETAAIGQSAEARKIAIALQQIDAEAKQKSAALSLKLSEAERKAAEAAITAERDKQKARVDTELRRQQAIAGAYQLEQENRRFAAESIFDEQARAQALLDIDAATWRDRIALTAAGTAERQRLEAAFQQWYANQLAKPAIDNVRNIVGSMDRTFHDGFTHMLEQGKTDWTAFSKSLANTFKTLVADQIYKMTIGKAIANVADAVVGGTGTAGAGGAAGSAAQTAGAVQQGMSYASMAKTAYAMYSGYSASGGAAGLGQAFIAGGNMTAAEAAAAANAYSTAGMSGTASAIQAGQYASTVGVASSGGASTAAGAAGVTEAGGATAGGASASAGAAGGSGASSGLAAAGWVAAIIAAIYTGFEWQKRGWFNDNNRGGYWKEGIEVLKKGYSQYDRLFGINRFTNYDGSGITGSFSTDGFEGQTYQDKSRKGGTFRSDKRWTDYSAVSTDMDAWLDSLMRQTVTGVQTTAKTLGLETEKAVQGYMHTFQLQLSENGSFDKAGEKIAGELSKVSDELATRLLPNIADFQRYGESASQTLERLSSEFKTTDAVLQLLGKTAEQAFGGAGIASATARERLIDYAGGMDQLTSKTASFFDHYYSEQERTQKAAEFAQQRINTAFGELGIAVPKTAAEFRNLVTAQDLNTDAGAKLFNQLLDLEGAFYSTQQAVDAAAAAERAAAEAARAASDTARGQQSGLFERYASDAQKLAQAQQQLTDAFGAYGMTVPKTRADFLALAQAQEPLTESGQKALAALDKLSGAFDIVSASATTAAEKQIAAMQRVTAQMDQVASYKAGIGQAQFDIRSKLPSFNAVGYYTSQSTSLRSQLAGAGGIEQRLGIGEQLKTSILARYQAEQDAIGKTRDAARTDFEARRQDAQKLLQLQQQSAQTQQQSARQWNDAMLRLREYAQSLLLSDASPLSPEARLAESGSQYNAMLQRAKGGDADAAGQLQGNAQSYLAAARDYYASGSGYSAIFD